MDYPFSLIEMRINAQGEGEGKFAVATRITYNKDKQVIELENYSSEPVRLTTIRAERITR
jgi:lipopolysaccharide export system protein LptA